MARSFAARIGLRSRAALDPPSAADGVAIYGFGLRSCAWVLLVRTRAFLSDALDASDSVFFIDDFVDGLSLTAFEARYAVTGESEPIRAVNLVSARLQRSISPA